MNRLAATRGLPKIIRSDNGKEFCDNAMVAWAHERGGQLCLIELGKPNQSAYIELFNGRPRGECVSEHCSPAGCMLESGSKTGDEKTAISDQKKLGGLTPAAYAKQLH